MSPDGSIALTDLWGTRQDARVLGFGFWVGVSGWVDGDGAVVGIFRDEAAV